MNIQCLPSSSFQPKTHRNAKTTLPASIHKDSRTLCFNPRIYYGHFSSGLQRTGRLSTHKKFATKGKGSSTQLREEPIKTSDKKGTIAGAVALIIGTSIGSGILALPQKASPAGFLPSSISLILCWGFLLIEALLLIEINVGLMKKKKKRVEDNEFEVISIRTMAQETLGEWGGTLATVTYIFLGYTSMVTYSSKSGDILYHLINLPASISGCFFTLAFTILISAGGTRATDQVNQWLTASMLVLCAYLDGDLPRLRASVLLGSFVPLLALLIWDAIALGLSAQADQVGDPVELLMRVQWSGFSFMVEAFSLLAIGTSLIGTLLGFSQFFKEQLNQLSRKSPSTQKLITKPSLLGVRKWLRRNKINFTATAMVVAPTLLVSTNFPDAFSAAMDIAGGYCMTMLYGVLPPAMAWAMQNKESEGTDPKALSRTRPALLGVGLFACGIVMEQIFQDLSALHP